MNDATGIKKKILTGKNAGKREDECVTRRRFKVDNREEFDSRLFHVTLSLRKCGGLPAESTMKSGIFERPLTFKGKETARILTKSQQPKAHQAKTYQRALNIDIKKFARTLYLRIHQTKLMKINENAYIQLLRYMKL